MKKQINIPLFRKNLKQCEPADEPAAGLSPGLKYLYENFYLPLLHEKPVLFKDIDFDKFDIDDVAEISMHSKEIKDDMRKLYQMNEKLVKTDPVLMKTVFI